ncbi:response regulator [Marinomonas agarivorans]|nr:response regulator [Marinomonas agarivorans]
MSNKVRPIEILLVEDNPGDIILTQEAFSEAKIWNNIHTAKDGEEALMYLRKSAGYEDSIQPDLILLDLNLPKIDGREVLDSVKSDDSLCHIPIVVLTSSEAEQDILKTYEMHANSYIVKPINLEQFATVINAIENFWFTVVALPTKAGFPSHNSLTKKPLE